MVLVRLNRKGDVPVKGVRVDLVTQEQGGARVAASTRSEESGYYLFRTVKPGKYRVVVPAQETERLKTRPATPLPADMPVGGDMVSGLDFFLEPIDAVPGRVVGADGAPGDQD